jgi:hypothetical protein
MDCAAPARSLYPHNIDSANRLLAVYTLVRLPAESGADKHGIPKRAHVAPG